MKLLLIYPPITAYGNLSAVPSITQPLGLLYIAGFMEAQGHEIKVLEARGASGKRIIQNENSILYGMTDEELYEAIADYQPELVGISNMWTAHSSDTHRVAAQVKKFDSKIPVVVGGAHASEFPKLVLKDSNIDFVVSGEGEETFADLVKRLEEGQPTDDVLGIIYRDQSGEVIKNESRPRVKELEDFPFPARHLVDMDLYMDETRSHKFLMRQPAVAMITSRGCPQKCTYCTIKAVWGTTWTSRSPKDVVDEMEHLIKEHGVSEFSLMDDSASVNKKRMHAFCDEIIERKLNIRWTTPNGIAHWTLNKELIYKMKKAGCYRITFGIESGNTEVRAQIKKKFALDRAKEVIRLCNEAGMWTICTFIMGFPYEDKAAMQDTIDFAQECDTDMAVFYLLLPNPTSDVYQDFKKEGLLNFDHVLDPSHEPTAEEFAQFEEVLSQRGLATKYCTAEELQEMLNLAYSSFFRHRIKSYLFFPWKILRKIRNFEDLRYTTQLMFAMAKPIKNFLTSKLANINMIWQDDYEDRITADDNKKSA